MFGSKARQAGESLMLTIFPFLLNFFILTPFLMPLPTAQLYTGLKNLLEGCLVYFAKK